MKVLGFKEKDALYFHGWNNTVPWYQITIDKLVPVVSVEWLKDLLNEIKEFDGTAEEWIVPLTKLKKAVRLQAKEKEK